MTRFVCRLAAQVVAVALVPIAAVTVATPGISSRNATRTGRATCGPTNASRHHRCRSGTYPGRPMRRHSHRRGYRHPLLRRRGSRGTSRCGTGVFSSGYSSGTDEPGVSQGEDRLGHASAAFVSAVCDVGYVTTAPSEADRHGPTQTPHGRVPVLRTRMARTAYLGGPQRAPTYPWMAMPYVR